MHWDFVLTCFEPISNVTGGIGTYTRLLLENLCTSGGRDGVKVLFLTPHALSAESARHLDTPSIQTVTIDTDATLEGVEVANIGDAHSIFSFKVAEYLERLCNSGDTIGLVEFSDFGRDGYFTIKKKRLGLITQGVMAVRLHSPDLILLPDNRLPLSKYDMETFFKIQQELYCYRFCDMILYGGDSMLARVEFETSKYGVHIQGKARKVPHPFRTLAPLAVTEHPPPEGDTRLGRVSTIMRESDSIKLVYTGRIERRKGIFEFLTSLARDQLISDIVIKSNIKIVACGKDTITGDNGQSLTAELQHQLSGTDLEDRILLADYIDQRDLYEFVLPNADAFVFPSLFENYPNAFLETLPFARPTLISTRGCMPELAEGFDFVRTYDPLGEGAAASIADFLTSLTVGGRRPDIGRTAHLRRGVDAYRLHSGRHNASMLAIYLNLIQTPSHTGEVRSSVPSTAFIVTLAGGTDESRECLGRLGSIVGAGDEVILLHDDRSDPPTAIKPGGEDLDIRTLDVGEALGSSHAKVLGARATDCELLQFLDSDELIKADGFARCRIALATNRDIDFVYGIQHMGGDRLRMWMPRDSSLEAIERSYSVGPILIRREVFLGIEATRGSFPHRRDDEDLDLTLALAGKRGEAIPCLTSRRWGSNPRSASDDGRDRARRARLFQRELESSAPVLRHPYDSTMLLHRLCMYAQRHETSGRGAEASANKRIIDGLSDSADGLTVTRSMTLDDALRIHVLEQHLASEFRLVVERTIDTVQHMARDQIVHYVETSRHFDKDWYLSLNTDVSAAGMDPCEHYALYGVYEDRNPNPSLSAVAMRKAVGVEIQAGEKINIFIVFAKLIGG